MAGMFGKFKIPIFFQTSSSRYLADHLQKLPKEKILSWLNLRNHQHFSLLFLLHQVRDFLKEEKAMCPLPMPLVIDAGLMKAESVAPLPPTWSSEFQEACLTFAHSQDSIYLQLADFAAFVGARMQWIVSGGVSKERDRKFLELISSQDLWFVNLPSISMPLDDSSSRIYDGLLAEDRELKTLTPFE